MSAWDSNGPSSYGQFGSDQGSYRRAEPNRTVIPMHPLSVGETLDGAIRLVRFNPVPFIVFPIVVNLVVAAIDTLLALLTGQAMTSDTATVSNAYLILSALITMIANLLVLVAGTRLTLATVRGQKLTLGETFSLARKDLVKIGLRLLGLIAIAFVASFLYIAVLIGIVATIFGNFFNPETGNGFVIILLILLIFGLTFVVFYRFSIVAPAMVAEDIGPVSGLARSWNLTKGSLGYFVGMFAALVGIGFVLSLVFGLLVSIMIGGFFINETAGNVGLTLGALGTILFTLVVSIVIAPIYTAITNLIYVNMRMKRENFHQEFLYLAGEAAAEQSAYDAGYGSGYGDSGQPDDWQGRPQWYGDTDNK